jgi:hypothetical protein
MPDIVFSKSLGKSADLEREFREPANFANFQRLYLRYSVIRVLRVEKLRL